MGTSPEMLAMAEWITSHIEMVEEWFTENKWIASHRRLFEEWVAENRLSCVNYIERQMHIFKTAATCSFAAAMKKGRARYFNANAESTPFPSESFDIVTVMYGFHEIPFQGRRRILKEAHRVLQPGGVLAVIDISPDYEPNESMLAGEPYVLEYQKNINEQLDNVKGFTRTTFETLIPGHVCMWKLERLPQ